MERPRQIEHYPAVQNALDKMREALPEIGLPDPDQSLKNPDCPVEAGSLSCLNAADSLCSFCAWWDKQAADAEEER